MLLALTVTALLSAPCEAVDTSKPARRLALALEREGRRAIAGRDASRPGWVVAVMMFGRGQLSLIAAEADVMPLQRAFDRRDFETVYRSLLTAPAAGRRYRLHDLHGLGLRARRLPGEAFDIVGQRGGPEVLFDGDWRAQGLSREEYCESFRRASERYARDLALLLAGRGPQRYD